MNNEKNRNEVNLDSETLLVLKEQAEKDRRSLKSYLEKVLTKHAERCKRSSNNKDKFQEDNPEEG